MHLPSKDVALFDVEDLLDEATSFPNAAHDDQVDATSQALARLLLRVGEGSAFLQHMKNQLGDQPKTSTRNWRETAQRMKEGGTDARTGRPQRP